MKLTTLLLLTMLLAPTDGEAPSEPPENEDSANIAATTVELVDRNPMCPVMPEETTDPTIFEVHRGKKVFFCCRTCRAAFQDTPEAFIPELPTDYLPEPKGPFSWETYAHGLSLLPSVFLGLALLLLLGHPLHGKGGLAAVGGVSLGASLASGWLGILAAHLWPPIARNVSIAHLEGQVAYGATAAVFVGAAFVGLRLSRREGIRAWFAGIDRTQLGLLLALLVGANVLTISRIPEPRTLGTASFDEATLWQAFNPGVFELWGTPPRVPVDETSTADSSSAPVLQAVAYRGNDERTSDLFNDGNYRTATLVTRIEDEDGEPVAPGDPVEGPLWLRFVIRRAPGSVDRMYLPSIMERIFITADADPFEAAPDDMVTVEATRDDWRWVARYPLGTPDEDLEGVIYVVNRIDIESQGESGKRYHAGIEYDIRVEDGRIAPDSSLWVGPLYIAKTIRAMEVPHELWLGPDPLPINVERAERLGHDTSEAYEPGDSP